MAVSYDCNWSPATVRGGSNYIKTNARHNGQVLSGAIADQYEGDRLKNNVTPVKTDYLINEW